MVKEKGNTVFLAIIACLLWSSAFAGVKVGLQYNLPFQFAGIRFVIAGILLLPFAIARNNVLQIFWRYKWKILLISMMQIFLTYALFYNGLNYVPGAMGAIIIGSSPLFIAGLSHFFMQGDRMSWKKGLVILFGFSGIVLVSVGRHGSVSGGALIYLGVFLLILNNILAGFTNILIAKDKGRIPPLVLSSLSMIIGGVLLFLLAIPVEGINFGPFPRDYYIALGWLSFLSAAAFTIWFSLLKRPGVKVSSLNMWKFLIPVSGAVLSWIIIENEQADVISVLGMILTGAALLGMQMVDRKL